MKKIKLKDGSVTLLSSQAILVFSKFSDLANTTVNQVIEFLCDHFQYEFP